MLNETQRNQSKLTDHQIVFEIYHIHLLNFTTTNNMIGSAKYQGCVFDSVEWFIRCNGAPRSIIRADNGWLRPSIIKSTGLLFNTLNKPLSITGETQQESIHDLISCNAPPI